MALYPINAVQIEVVPCPGSFCLRNEPETPTFNKVDLVMSISMFIRYVHLRKFVFVL